MYTVNFTLGSSKDVPATLLAYAEGNVVQEQNGSFTLKAPRILNEDVAKLARLTALQGAEQIAPVYTITISEPANPEKIELVGGKRKGPPLYREVERMPLVLAI